MPVYGGSPNTFSPTTLKMTNGRGDGRSKKTTDRDGTNQEC